MKFKTIVALALTVSLVFGSSLTVFADGGVQEGTGTYEGGEMKYPTLSVTLPTIPEGTYDYIADPNGLIAATSAAHYGGATFDGTSGLYFKTTDAVGDTKAIYSNKSKALTLTNENAQDIDVTIKLEQKTAGSEGIGYSDTASFESTDKDQKIYLAVTDDAASNAQISALSSTVAATLTTKVDGTKGNYKPNWDETNNYGYVLDTTKQTDGKYSWQSCSYTLTGALNTNAEWGDSVSFPTIKVTWSYAEHQDNVAPSIATTSYTVDGSEDVAVTLNLGSGTLAATGVEAISFASTTGEVKTLDASLYSVSGTTLTISKDQVSAWIGAGLSSRKYTVKFNDTAKTEVEITFAKDEG